MSYPVVEDVTATNDQTTSPHAINYPATVNAGDLLIVIFVCDDDETITCSAFTQIYNEDAGPQGPTMYVGWREAVGDEDGTTFDITGGVNEDSVAYVFRISGAEDPDTQPPQATAEATGAGINPDPPSITPTGGSKDYLWIAAEGNDDDDAATGWPSNMADNNIGQVNASVGMAVASEQSTATSFDPAVFTIPTEQWEAVTIAVHPPSGASQETKTFTSDVVSVDRLTKTFTTDLIAAGTKSFTADLVAGVAPTKTFTSDLRLTSSLLFRDGFEDNDDTFPLWDGVSVDTGCTVTVVSSQVYHNRYAMQAYIDGDDIGDWAYIFINPESSSLDKIYLRTKFRVSALPPDNTEQNFIIGAEAFGDAWRYLGHVTVYNDGGTTKFRLRYYTVAGGDQLYILTSKVVAVDTDYTVELYIYMNDSGQVTLKIDGVLEADTGTIDNYDATATGPAIDRAGLGCVPMSPRTADYECYYRFDDFAYDDTPIGTSDEPFNYLQIPTDMVLVDRETNTFTADAHLIGVIDKTFTADVVLATGAETKEFTSDLVTVDRLTDTFTSDIVAVDRLTDTFSADSVLVDRLTTTFTSDVIIAGQQTFTVDLVSVERITKTLTGDIVVVERYTDTFTTDGVLVDRLTDTFTADLYVAGTVLFTADMVLSAGATKTFEADMHLLAVRTDTFTTDVVAVDRLTDTFTVDLVIVGTEQFTADSVLVDRLTDSFTSDLVAVDRLTDTFTTDLITVDRLTDTFTADLILAKRKSFTVDLVAADRLTDTFTADIVAVDRLSDTFTGDLVAVDRLTDTFTADVVLFGTEQFTADMVLTTPNAKQFTADMVLQGALTKDFTSDLATVDRLTDTFTADLILAMRATFTTDVALVDRFTDTFTADLIIAGTETFTADMVLTAPSAKSFTSDIVLIDRLTTSATADLVAVDRLTTIFSGDLITKGVYTDTFTSDIVAVDRLTYTFTTDMSLLLRTTKTFTTDIVTLQAQVKTFTADLITSTYWVGLRGTFTQKLRGNRIVQRLRGRVYTQK